MFLLKDSNYFLSHCLLVHEPSVDETGANGIHPDVLSRIFQCTSLSKSNDTVFSSDVRRGILETNASKNGSHVYHTATTCLHHLRKLISHTVEYSGQVNVDHFLPGVNRIFPCWSRCTADSCII